MTPLHTTKIQRNHLTDDAFAIYSHLVVCSCGHQSLAPNEEMAEIHAAAHSHVHWLEEKRNGFAEPGKAEWGC